MNMKSQSNKIALVTGASSGIGQASAAALAKAGDTAYGTSRRGGGAGARPFEMLPLDVTRDASVADAVAQLMQREGRIDLLVNDAGFGVAPAGAEESSIAQAQSTKHAIKAIPSRSTMSCAQGASGSRSSSRFEGICDSTGRWR